MKLNEEKAFEDILSTFCMLYRTNSRYGPRKFPKLPELSPLLPQYTPLTIEATIISDRFAEAANRRGVPYWRTQAEQRGLTSRMMAAASVILDMSIPGSLTTRLKRVGVTYNEYQTWLKEPHFKAIIDQGAEQQLHHAYPEMNRALVNQATKGDVTAIKFAYELMGKYDPNSKQTIEAQQAIGYMIEIIQKNVTDPATLGRIAQDMEGLISKLGMGLPVAAVEGSYEVTFEENTHPVAGEIYADNYETRATEA